MLFYGSHGTLCLYYKGELISSYPISSKKTFQRYYNQGEELIYQSKHVPIKTQIKVYLQFCNMMYSRKKNKLAIRRSDHIHFLNCLMALLRLRIIENCELNGYMIFKDRHKIKQPSLI